MVRKSRQGLEGTNRPKESWARRMVCTDVRDTEESLAWFVRFVVHASYRTMRALAYALQRIVDRRMPNKRSREITGIGEHEIVQTFQTCITSMISCTKICIKTLCQYQLIY
jgi:hypothetical protein